MVATTLSLTPGKRVLFLTKDPRLIRQQLAGTLDLQMKDLSVDQLLDDVNTDAMSPAWACFDWRPEDIAKNAYAGMTVDGERLFPEGSLQAGNFEVIVSGLRKGVGSSRETAVQAEKWSGIRLAVAASFAPIHARNNINQGVFMCGHGILHRLQAGEAVSVDDLTRDLDPLSRAILVAGGLFPFTRLVAGGQASVPRPDTGERAMTMAEKILARHLVGEVDSRSYVKAGDAVAVRVDGGYSHEFTTAQVHAFLADEHGPDYRLANPHKFAVFEDHLIYADGVSRMAPFAKKIQALRDLQNEFQRHTHVRDFSAKDGVSPGICHTIAREQIIEPGDFIQATDSHTCMGGAVGALAYGVGTTEYAALVHAGLTFVVVPESIRFELRGSLRPGCTAKDVMLHILCNHAKQQLTLDRVMEFGGPGLRSLNPDERATLANMATECAAKAGLCEVDETQLAWIAARRPTTSLPKLREMAADLGPDPGAEYAGGIHIIDLSQVRPMVATPGDAARGISSDPTNGAFIDDLGQVRVDIAYGGSCTAGKEADIDQYATVMRDALESGRKVSADFYIQFGSKAVEDYARARGYLELFAETGVKVIAPGCGACIGCGPGVSTRTDQVTISAINRNYQNRSGPGQLFLASPLNVAASAVAGHIVAYKPGMFRPR